MSNHGMKSKKEMESIAPGELLTPKQTSALLNVPEATLAVWRSTNRVVIPFLKMGHHVRYRRSDLERFINDNMKNVQEVKS